MLVEQPVRRPTVFEVLRLAHDMSGTRPEVDYVRLSSHLRALLTIASAQSVSLHPRVLSGPLSSTSETIHILLEPIGLYLTTI